MAKYDLLSPEPDGAPKTVFLFAALGAALVCLAVLLAVFYFVPFAHVQSDVYGLEAVQQEIKKNMSALILAYDEHVELLKTKLVVLSQEIDSLRESQGNPLNSDAIEGIKKDMQTRTAEMVAKTIAPLQEGEAALQRTLACMQRLATAPDTLKHFAFTGSVELSKSGVHSTHHLRCAVAVDGRSVNCTSEGQSHSLQACGYSSGRGAYTCNPETSFLNGGVLDLSEATARIIPNVFSCRTHHAQAVGMGGGEEPAGTEQPHLPFFFGVTLGESGVVVPWFEVASPFASYHLVGPQPFNCRCSALGADGTCALVAGEDHPLAVPLPALLHPPHLALSFGLQGVCLSTTDPSGRCVTFIPSSPPVYLHSLALYPALSMQAVMQQCGGA